MVCVYTNFGKLNLFNAKYELDDRPIEGAGVRPTISRAYIRHLLKAKEMLGMRLCVLHNLYFYNHLMEEIPRIFIRNTGTVHLKKKKLESFSKGSETWRLQAFDRDIKQRRYYAMQWAIIIVYPDFAVFLYFISIRPQKKQQKKWIQCSLPWRLGNSILTTSGFYGVVIDITDEVVIVEFGSKTCRIQCRRQRSFKLKELAAKIRLLCQ